MNPTTECEVSGTEYYDIWKVSVLFIATSIMYGIAHVDSVVLSFNDGI